jgi:hypothetical protein
VEVSNQLSGDMSRCYGYMCPVREECKRFLTIAQDALFDEKNGPRLRSYVSTMRDETFGVVDDDDCTGFIKAE